MTRQRHTKRWAGALLVSALLLSACGGSDGAAESSSASATDAATTASGTTASGSTDADTSDTTGSDSSASESTATDSTESDDCGVSADLVSAAQDEGEVTVYTGGHTREAAELVSKLFKDTYGIEATMVRQPSGDVVQQLEAERSAGSTSADVVALADASQFVKWQEEGVLAPADIPNTADFIEGLDDASTDAIPFSLVPLGIMYNNANTDESALPTTWTALADEYDGVVATADPATSGTALFYSWAMNDAVGADFFTRLKDGAQVLVTDSSLALTQMVAVGEADIAVPAIEVAVIGAAAEGEPLAISFPTDGVPVFTSELSVIDGAPHPNAAKLLVAFHACASTQQALADTGARSVLSSVPTPDAVADLGDRPLISTTPADLLAARDDLLASFEAAR